MNPPKTEKESVAINLSYVTILGFAVFGSVYACGIGINFLVALLWLISRSEELSRNQIGGFTTMALLLPLTFYFIVAVKFAVIKAYALLYEKVIKQWVNPFAQHICELVWTRKDLLNKEISKELQQGAKDTSFYDIEDKALLWLNAKIHSLPPFIAKVLVFILNRTSLGNFIFYADMGWMQKMNAKEELIEELNSKIERFLKNIIKVFFPFWTKLIIPANTVILIALFLYK